MSRSICEECKFATVVCSVDVETGEIIPRTSYCKKLLWKNTDSPECASKSRCSQFRRDGDTSMLEILIDIVVQIHEKHGRSMVERLTRTPLESKK